MKKTIHIILACAALAAAGFAQSVNESGWGKTKDGTPVKLFTLKNDKGMAVEITNYGGRIVKIVVPDRDGKPATWFWASTLSPATRAATIRISAR